VSFSIVHVLSSFGVGGQERVALDLAIGQKALGHRVGVMSLAPAPDGALADEFAAAGIDIMRVEKRAQGIDPTLTARIGLALKKRGVDVVHTHNPMPLIYAAPAARLVGAAAIHTKHGRNPANFSNRALRRVAAQWVNFFVAVSDITAEQALAQHDCPPSKLRTIPNGIRLERYVPDAKARAETRAELGLGDAWVVGTVGRLDEFKNQRMLIRAMAPMLSQTCRLVIVGDGPSRSEVEAEVARLPEPRFCVLTGRRMDVPRIMPAFDVFALSSTSEGLPLVVPEAMSAGLPVVATEVGGLPSVVDEDSTGKLVAVDEKAMRNALAELMADRARTRSMGATARKTAHARFSAERMNQEYLALYQQARG
jgi:glycosyltransferase involved in cell wall biosynthesis